MEWDFQEQSLVRIKKEKRKSKEKGEKRSEEKKSRRGKEGGGRRAEGGAWRGKRRSGRKK